MRKLFEEQVMKLIEVMTDVIKNLKDEVKKEVKKVASHIYSFYSINFIVRDISNILYNISLLFFVVV
jgi:hypothetical protein